MISKKKHHLSHVDKNDLATGLRKLGVSPGMSLMVHASLSSFGHVEDGAQTVIAVLMDILTPEGTLLMPSFNHDVPFRENGPGIYDPQKTPTSNGKIPDIFWRQPGIHRSLNPTHPFAAWGKNAQRYTAHHHLTLTMGTKSPLGLLLADDGYCLLLGVDYKVNTFHHVVEMSTGAPCLGRRTEAYPVRMPDGRQVLGRTWGWRGGTCPFTDQNRYADQMQDKHHQVNIGDACVTFYRLRDCFSVVADILAHGKDEFPPCHQCTVRPRQVAQTVASDWDDEQQCLKQ